MADNLPTCTHFAQSLQNIEAAHPRAPIPPASAEQQHTIRAALTELTDARLLRTT